MPHFTSARERRLWFWTLAVIGAIYATLGPAGSVVLALRERNLLRLSFVVVALPLMLRGRPDNKGIVAQPQPSLVSQP